MLNLELSYSTATPALRQASDLPMIDAGSPHARATGFLSLIQRSVSVLGPDLQVRQPDGSVKLLLGRAEYGDSWRRNSRLLIKEVDDERAPASLARLILDNNLTTAREGAEWEEMRARVAPLMRYKMQSYAQALSTAADVLSYRLLANSEKSLWSLCGLWSAQTVAQPVLGFSFPDHVVLDLVNQLRACMFHLVQQADALPRNALLVDPVLLRLRASLAQVVRDAIRMSKPGDQTMIATLLADAGHQPGTDAPCTLVARLQPILIGAIAAAVHNNSLALYWTLTRLAAHPEVAATLGQEADELADHPEGLITQRPKALAAVREALRLNPVLPFIERKAADDMVLADIAVRGGTTVIFAPWVVHRDPLSWPDPLRFNPSRFADSARVDLTRWFPFGLGHRACIGSNLALSQLVVTVSRLCRDLHLALHPENQPVQTVPVWRVLLEPRADGARLLAHRRARNLSQTLSRP
jgi:cytochrome P450